MRNWTMVASMSRPISPPKASISRTRLPLESPPMAGLQDIIPMRSGFWVIIRVLKPSRAKAKAASMPA
jgi:hypothetical protein